MPLPTDDSTPWPPKWLDRVTPVLARWSAWYSGEPDQLTAIYGGVVNPGSTWIQSGVPAATMRGGIVGTLARMFWGSPNEVQGEKSPKMHIPAAGDIASVSADLLFSESPSLSFPDTTSKATSDRVDEYLEDGLWTSIREAAEVQAGLGGVYLRAVWDTDLRPRPWLQAAHPDVAVPEWSYDQLSAVTFWKVVWSDSRRVLRHLERHELGAILHGLYEGTKNELGHRIPLTESEETAKIIPSLTDGDAIATGIDMLTVVYVPNVRPNRVWRTVPEAVNLGRSDYQSLEGPMDALDEAWTSWMRDLRLGKARVIVDQSVLSTQGPGLGARFNIDQELLVGLNLGSDIDKAPITPVQFEIRFEAHERTTRALFEQIVRGAGYSTQTFTGDTDGTGITATEVQAKEKRSLTTRDRKIAYWSHGLTRALEMLLALDASLFSSGAEVERPKIEFPDAVSAGQKEVAETLQLLDAAKAISVDTKIRMLHPDWDDEQIEQEIEDIQGASQLAQTADALTRLGQATALGVVSEDQAQQTATARLAPRQRRGQSDPPAD